MPKHSYQPSMAEPSEFSRDPWGVLRQPTCSQVRRAATGEDLHRASICVMSDSEEEQAEFAAWLVDWKSATHYVSEDYGCGCCIHLYDVECRQAAIDAIPRNLRTITRWTEGVF